MVKHMEILPQEEKTNISLSLSWSVHYKQVYFSEECVKFQVFFAEKFVWDTNSICETGIQSVSLLTRGLNWSGVKKHWWFPSRLILS